MFLRKRHHGNKLREHPSEIVKNEEQYDAIKRDIKIIIKAMSISAMRYALHNFPTTYTDDTL